MQSKEQKDIQCVELPKKMLQHVFRYLSIQDLLQGTAGVCREWREAVVDPIVWRHRSFNYKCEFWRRPSFLKAVLSVAPCLLSLEVGHEHLLDDEAVKILSNTSCAVEDFKLCNIEFIVFTSVRLEDRHRDTWEPIVQRQVALGRLTTLRLQLNKACAAKLINILRGAALSQLDVTLDRVKLEPLMDLPSPVAHQQASLKRISFHPDSSVSLVLQHLLESHKATLEEVAVRGLCTGPVLELLRKCTRLQKLTLRCDDSLDLSLLKSCVQLRTLTIGLRGDGHASLLLAYLREATDLTELSIRTQHHVLLVDLVEAISSSGRSALQVLRLSSGSGKGGKVNLNPGALARLPRLRELSFVGSNISPSQVFLDAIFPANAPSLRLIKIEDFYAIHLSALRRLVQRNPKLHVMVLGLKEFADFGCAAYAYTNSYSELSRCLFGHPPSEACDVVQHRNNEVNWVFVGATALNA